MAIDGRFFGNPDWETSHHIGVHLRIIANIVDNQGFAVWLARTRQKIMTAWDTAERELRIEPAERQPFMLAVYCKSGNTAVSRSQRS